MGAQFIFFPANFRFNGKVTNEKFVYGLRKIAENNYNASFNYIQPSKFRIVIFFYFKMILFINPTSHITDITL